MARQAAHGMKRPRLIAHMLGFCGANLIVGTLTFWLLQAFGRIEQPSGWTALELGLLCLGIVLVTRGAQRITAPSASQSGFGQALRNSGG